MAGKGPVMTRAGQSRRLPASYGFRLCKPSSRIPIAENPVIETLLRTWGFRRDRFRYPEGINRKPHHTNGRDRGPLVPVADFRETSDFRKENPRESTVPRVSVWGRWYQVS
jgi:hypothetical protein